jgi:hypothetical protein
MEANYNNRTEMLTLGQAATSCAYLPAGRLIPKSALSRNPLKQREKALIYAAFYLWMTLQSRVL